MKKEQRKATESKRTIVFNSYFVLWLLGFGFTLWGIIYLYTLENKLSWLLIAFLIVFALALFADSVCYIFTKEEIHFVTFWGYKWCIPWRNITSITKYTFLDSLTLKKLMGYEVYYDQPYKGRLIRKTLLLAITPTVKKCLNKFWCGEIRFETKRKKKK